MMARKPIAGLETALEACEFFNGPKVDSNTCILPKEGS